MKNTSGIIALLLVAALGFGCSAFGDDYDHLQSVAQSGELICVVRARYSAELKVRRPLTKAELFLHGFPYKSEEFPELTVRGCDSLNDKLMTLSADDGAYLMFENEGRFEIRKLDSVDGVLSNDAPWFVGEDGRTNIVAGEKIAFKTKLPSGFIANSPDWKTIVTEGENLVERNLISLYVVDTETGVAQKRYVRRADYLFMLDQTHGSAWIGRHFGWVPAADGRFRLVYPVLEKIDEKSGDK
ncbi:MAG: hypothetical protein JSS81_05635 [Acidobacteria bacterium]|nr:hypothetical protein [Acidobacteriota bacterium]